MSLYYTGDKASGYEGPGYECFECGHIGEGEPPAECDDCGDENLGSVTLSNCPADGDDCDDPEHHYGRGDHVMSVSA